MTRNWRRTTVAFALWSVLLILLNVSLLFILELPTPVAARISETRILSLLSSFAEIPWLALSFDGTFHDRGLETSPLSASPGALSFVPGPKGRGIRIDSRLDFPFPSHWGILPKSTLEFWVRIETEEAAIPEGVLASFLTDTLGVEIFPDRIRLAALRNGSIHSSTIPGVPIADSQWHFIVVTTDLQSDRGSREVFLDGIPVFRSHERSDHPEQPQNRFRISPGVITATSTVQVMVDEIRFFPYLRSKAEITLEARKGGITERTGVPEAVLKRTAERPLHDVSNVTHAVRRAEDSPFSLYVLSQDLGNRSIDGIEVLGDSLWAGCSHGFLRHPLAGAEWFFYSSEGILPQPSSCDSCGRVDPKPSGKVLAGFGGGLGIETRSCPHSPPKMTWFQLDLGSRKELLNGFHYAQGFPDGLWIAFGDATLSWFPFSKQGLPEPLLRISSFTTKISPSINSISRSSRKLFLAAGNGGESSRGAVFKSYDVLRDAVSNLPREEGWPDCQQAWLAADDNEVWVKSYPGDLSCFEVKRNSWKEKRVKIDQIHGIDSSLALEDRWVWCGGWKKLYRVNRRTMEVRAWGSEEKWPFEVVSHIKGTAEGLWIAGRTLTPSLLQPGIIGIAFLPRQMADQ